MSSATIKEIAKEKIILVVDDNEDIRYVLTTSLVVEGYSVLQASSGMSALKVLDEQPVDLILSDIEMTDGDGFFLLKEIQSRKITPQLVFISGHAEISAESVKKLGAVDLIRKPFNTHTLFTLVSSLIAD